MHYFKGNSPENYHKFALFHTPTNRSHFNGPKMVPKLMDPRRWVDATQLCHATRWHPRKTALMSSFQPQIHVAPRRQRWLPSSTRSRRRPRRRRALTFSFTQTLVVEPTHSKNMRSRQFGSKYPKKNGVNIKKYLSCHHLEHDIFIFVVICSHWLSLYLNIQLNMSDPMDSVEI